MKLNKVTWLDACDHTHIFEHRIDSVRQYLVERVTYGLVIKEDKDGIIILQDKQESGECEIVAIPKRMLVSVK